METSNPEARVRLTGRLWAAAERAVLSPNWLSQGHWAVRRENFQDEALLALAEGEAQCRLLEHVLRIRRGTVKEVRNTVDDDRILSAAFPTARARKATRPRLRYERTPLAYEVKGVVGIVYRTGGGGIVVVDRTLADAFKLVALYGPGGLATLADAETPEGCRFLVSPMNPDDAAAAVRAAGL